MKKSFALLTSISFFVFLNAQKIDLPKTWKFNAGDNIQWSATAFDDSKWQDVPIGQIWQKSGIKATGFVWYRTKVVIPSSIKKAMKPDARVMVCLGMIDDVDDAYFNGKKIGSTGKINPLQTGWGMIRFYYVTANDVKWDSENTLAVRVYSPDTIGGGMYSGPYFIGLPEAKTWPNEIPADCPFPKSESFNNITFTGNFATYANADTWYPSWASDDKLYSPFTDGSVDGVTSGSWERDKQPATTGNAIIEGNDPLNLKVTPLASTVGSALPYAGRYPCGSLMYNGVWYYGTYCLDDANNNPADSLNWDVMGPFVGFRVSKDFGKTWDCPHSCANPLFGETAKNGTKVKIGSPHVVDFGKNMQYSPDGYAYLVAHGSHDPDPKPRYSNCSWINGDEVYLVRVKPSIENMNDASKYEYFSGYDDQKKPIWSKDFSKIKPLLEWNNNMGCVTATYNPVLKKYLMCVTDGWPTTKSMRTYILESSSITGPWKIVTYMNRFGPQSYFVNIPSKFIQPDGKTFYLCYAANFCVFNDPSMWIANPLGGRYGMCLFEVKLEEKK
jgi:hypothetical protein